MCAWLREAVSIHGIIKEYPPLRVPKWVGRHKSGWLTVAFHIKKSVFEMCRFKVFGLPASCTYMLFLQELLYNNIVFMELVISNS